MEQSSRSYLVPLPIYEILYRVSRGGTQAAYAAGGLGATGGGRRHDGARPERFGVGRWAEGQRGQTHAPTLKDFYSEIRTVH